MAKVKTRFCPSPTGLMHIGNARTALFNMLYALKHNGVFLLRIEDTDAERSEQRYVDALCEDLQWLNLDWHQGFGKDNDQSYQQSQRGDIYRHYFNELTQKGRIYPCFCSADKLAANRKIQLKLGQAPRYDGTCRHLNAPDISQSHTLRFKVTSGHTDFDDAIKGRQHYRNEDIGDFIVKRSQGAEGFFFTNAIDDALMGVTQVLRGEDHLTNTPRQIMILEALGLPIPNYAHIALTLGADGKPLSKRNGSMSISELRQMGYFPIALINYLARLGHSYDSNQLLSLAELGRQFDETRLGKAPAKFDINQLNHWQQLALNTQSDESLQQWIGADTNALVPADKLLKFIAAVRANVLFPKDMQLWATHLFTEVSVAAADLEKLTQVPSVFFDVLIDALAQQQPYTELVDTIKQKTGLSGKALFLPLRIALTAKSFGPEMAKILPLMDSNLLVKRVKLLTRLV